MKSALTWVGRLAVLVALAYLSHSLFRNSIALGEAEFPPAVWPALAGGVVLLFFSAVFYCIAFHRILLALGEKVGLRPVMALILLSQIGKYLPGNVTHFLGRVVLAEREGISKKGVLFGLSYEIGWLVLGAGIVAFPYVLVEGPHRIGLEGISDIGGWILMGFGLLLVLPPIGTWILKRRRPGFLTRHLSNAVPNLPGVGVASACLALYVLAVGCNGLMAYLLCIVIAPVGLNEIQIIVGGYAVAWIVGFVVPGAPGGLGVREVILVTILTPLMGETIALQVTLLQRLVSVLADGVCFWTGWVLSRSKAQE